MQTPRLRVAEGGGSRPLAIAICCKLVHLAAQLVHAEVEVQLEGRRVDAPLPRPQQRRQAAGDRGYLQPRRPAVGQHVLHLNAAGRVMFETSRGDHTVWTTG